MEEKSEYPQPSNDPVREKVALTGSPCDPSGLQTWENIDFDPDKSGAPNDGSYAITGFTVAGTIVSAVFVGQNGSESKVNGTCVPEGGHERLDFQSTINNHTFIFSGEVHTLAGGTGVIQNGRYQVKAATSGATARINVPSDPGETGGWGGTNGA